MHTHTHTQNTRLQRSNKTNELNDSHIPCIFSKIATCLKFARFRLFMGCVCDVVRSLVFFFGFLWVEMSAIAIWVRECNSCGKDSFCCIDVCRYARICQFIHMSLTAVCAILLCFIVFSFCCCSRLHLTCLLFDSHTSTAPFVICQQMTGFAPSYDRIKNETKRNNSQQLNDTLRSQTSDYLTTPVLILWSACVLCARHILFFYSLSFLVTSLLLPNVSSHHVYCITTIDTMKWKTIHKIGRCFFKRYVQDKRLARNEMVRTEDKEI